MVKILTVKIRPQCKRFCESASSTIALDVFNKAPQLITVGETSHACRKVAKSLAQGNPLTHCDSKCSDFFVLHPYSRQASLMILFCRPSRRVCDERSISGGLSSSVGGHTGRRDRGEVRGRAEELARTVGHHRDAHGSHL